MTIRTASAFAGISEDTVARRRRTDKAFDAKVVAALEEFKAQSQVIIAHAGLKVWTARACLLERRFPEEFGEEFGRQRLEMSGAGGGPIKIESELALASKIRANPEALRALDDALFPKT